MIHMMVRHKVADYGRWKEVFDANLNTRKANGEIAYQLFVSTDDPLDVTLVMDWDGLEQARRFSESDDLKQTMQKAGVVGEPEVRFLRDALRVRRSAAD
jgi:quinol monooxygenase YgiN